jgi:electron transfer flavoprotein alpha subunit
MANNVKNGPVWVVAEMKGKGLQPVSVQLVGKARQLADRLDEKVAALLMGKDVGGGAAELIAAGADTVYAADSELLELYQAELHAEIVTSLVQDGKPSILLLGSTFIGRELAPILAARLKTGLTAHCIDLVLGDNNILDQLIPAYGGLISIVCPEKRPQMATVARGVFPTPEPDCSREGQIVEVAVPRMELHSRTVEILKVDNDEKSIETEPFVIAGGAGAGDEQGWRQIIELASELGAAVGCTRPAVDSGWADLETMIGQSGKMVSPEFYLGVGLSGELQHMVGIKGARLMAAINNDAKSPVFEQVDIGVVEDCRTFVPLLIKKIRAYRQNR